MTRIRQRSTIAIAMLCLVAQVFAVAHLVLVRHARCAEHGGVAHAAIVEGAPETVAPSPHEVLGANHLPAHASDDDHCEWLSEARDHRHASVPAITCVPVSHVERVLAVPLTVAVSRPLYRLAPKLSPPRLVA